MTCSRCGKSDEISKKKQLLVEGRTAELFFSALLKSIGLSHVAQVRDFRGVQELKGYLRVFTQRAEFKEIVESVGIIRDAENQPADASFQSVCSSLAHAKLGRPDKLGKFSNGTPRTGVFVLPNCRDAGMLETVCWNALEGDSKNRAHLDCVNSHLGCLEAAGVRPKNTTKAKIWTYLSGMGEFEPQVGRTAQRDEFNWQSPVLAPLAEFLLAL